MEEGNKSQYLLKFFDPKPYQMDIIHIDLDQTDLGLADVLRNLNSILPINSRERNSIIAGFKVIGVLCTSELLSPTGGVLMFIVGPETKTNLVSNKYIIMSIDEARIRTDKDIAELLDAITMYMITDYQEIIPKFTEFFTKFIFDDYEDEFYNF